MARPSTPGRCFAGPPCAARSITSFRSPTRPTRTLRSGSRRLWSRPSPSIDQARPVRRCRTSRPPVPPRDGGGCVHTAAMPARRIGRRGGPSVSSRPRGPFPTRYQPPSSARPIARPTLAPTSLGSRCCAGSLSPAPRAIGSSSVGTAPPALRIPGSMSERRPCRSTSTSDRGRATGRRGPSSPARLPGARSR